MHRVAATRSVASFPVLCKSMFFFFLKRKSRERKSHISMDQTGDKSGGDRRIAAANAGRGCLTELIDMIIHTIS